MSSYIEGQTHQLLDSLEMHGYTAKHLTTLGQLGDRHSLVKAYLDGHADIKLVEHVIDCDADPKPYAGLKIEEHKKGGQLVWNPALLHLHLSPNQQNGKVVVGHELRKELAREKVLNANVLDYLLANPHLIPEEWKQDEQGRTRYIFFWGTIYRVSDGYLCVRYLYWSEGRFRGGNDWLDDGWGDQDPAAVSAS